MAETWIHISHPNLPNNDPVVVAESAFNDLHSRKGWVVANAEKETVVEADAVKAKPRKPPTRKPPTK